MSDASPGGGQVDGRSTLVTGAAGGIGRATAAALAREGADVALLDVDEERGRSAARELDSAHQGEIFFLEADASRSDEVDRAVSRAAERMGGLDGLVNVVGVSGRKWGDGPVTECTEEAWDNLMAINLKSTFLCCKYALRIMETAEKESTGEGDEEDEPPDDARIGGSVVNVSSVLGLVGGDADFATHAYSATKGGIISLTRSIATYYAPERIRANAVCPGLIRTPMSERAQSDPHIIDRLTELQPLTGDFGAPEDVAEAALYLISDRSSFVTGTVLPVDGGWTAK